MMGYLALILFLLFVIIVHLRKTKDNKRLWIKAVIYYFVAYVFWIEILELFFNKEIWPEGLAIVLTIATFGIIPITARIKVLPSPDGQHVAVVFLRFYAYASNTSNVSLKQKGKRTLNWFGNVFVRELVTYIDVEWEDNATLVIFTDPKDIYHGTSLKKEEVLGIKIKYAHKESEGV